MARSPSQVELIRRYLLDQNEMFNGEDNPVPTETVSLSPQDSAIEKELNILEQQFYDYSQPSFQSSQLEFLPSALGFRSASEAVDLTIDNVLNLFPSAAASTKRLSYRIQGYRALLSSLGNIHTSSPILEDHRSSLQSIITHELQSLLLAVEAERDSRLGIRAQYPDIRHVNPILSSSLSRRSKSPVVTACIILVAIIHCMMGVARDHCSLVLKGFQSILWISANMQDARSAGVFGSNHINSIPTTLPTALIYLDLLDPIELYVVCPNCDALYKEDQDEEVPDTCTEVDLDGDICGAELFTRHHRGSRTWRQPIRRFSHQPLESWLARFLNRPDIEELLERTSPCPNSTYTDIWEARFFSEFPSASEPSFFVCPSNELRLAFLVYHDFFNPYSNMTAGKKVSTGVVMMVCLNLPADVRYDLKNIYVTAMLPGPKEPALENINKFMRPIVDNLVEHYETGVYLTQTHKYPQGRKVRSVVPINSMDIPASRAFGGISKKGFPT